MSITVAIPNGELACRGWLAQRFPSPVRVVLETPGNLGNVLPVIRTKWLGSAESARVLHTGRLVVDVFHVGTEQALQLALDVQAAVLWQLPGSVFNGVTFTHSRTFSGPQNAYWSDTLRRYVATYEISLKA